MSEFDMASEAEVLHARAASIGNVRGDNIPETAWVRATAWLWYRKRPWKTPIRLMYWRHEEGAQP